MVIVKVEAANAVKVKARKASQVGSSTAIVSHVGTRMCRGVRVLSRRDGSGSGFIQHAAI
jgi:hypothetical protein